MKFYAETNTELFTEKEIREEIRSKSNFYDEVQKFVDERCSFLNLFRHLDKEYQRELIEGTIDNIIEEHYYKIDINV